MVSYELMQHIGHECYLDVSDTYAPRFETLVGKEDGDFRFVGSRVIVGRIGWPQRSPLAAGVDNIAEVNRVDRKEQRLPAMLAVRFASAAEFVTEYAENLSAGGLFVRNAYELELLSVVEVEIDLPGYRTFQVKAKVAHVLPPQMAERFHRSAGAGLQLLEVPVDFEAALMNYLSRLGRRRDCLLFVDEPECRTFLGDAGFRTEESADLERASRVAKTKAHAVVAVVVPSTKMGKTVDALRSSSVNVLQCDGVDEVLPLLGQLDDLLDSAA